ncbi:PadR family transcriptional regulator [Dictyobacter formicarum]|uniref:PadR family transcriptional regulator n=1 Tax=Dictyobacter formicarum TaxID=2778368 RepID=A0ABQ3V9Y0_9CHLR|nr:PadR family transcriptional regulator [Dictyobacter formicarum]GHO82036.1 hypothetical protein KSZ_00420 [Dictyobacter formicarum]
MNELLVLGLLMHWPLHAYRLAKIANNILGPDGHISRGTLSGLLTKLEQAGFVTDAAPSEAPFPSDRTSRVLVITPAGRERFLQLMLDVPSQLDVARFHIKALHLEFLPLEKRLFLIEHFLLSCQNFVRDKQTELQMFGTEPGQQEHISGTFFWGIQAFMGLKIEQVQLEITWAQSLREHVVSRLRPEALS